MKHVYRVEFGSNLSTEVEARSVTQAIVKAIEFCGKGDELYLEVRVKKITKAKVDARQLSLTEVADA